MAIDAALGRLGNKSGVCTSSTRPTNPFEGQLIYETDTNRTLVYDNAAWLVVADNQVLSIDSANSRIGINDATPSYKLDVNGDINATDNLRIGGTAIGEWTAYTPTLSNLATTSMDCKYCKINKIVFVNYSFDVSSVTGTPSFSMPSAVGDTDSLLGHGALMLDSGAGWYAAISVPGGAGVGWYIPQVFGTYASYTGTNSQKPFMWMMDDRIVGNLWYLEA